MKQVLIFASIVLGIHSCNYESSNEQLDSYSNETILVNRNNTLEGSIKSNTIFIGEFADTIKKHQLGIIKIGDTIVNILRVLDQKCLVAFDSISNNYEELEYEFFYIISDLDNQKLFRLLIDKNRFGEEFVKFIEVYSNKYITDKGIRIGDNLSQLKMIYTIKLLDFNYNDGLWLFTNEFDGCFQLDLLTKGIEEFNFENPILDSIPENIKIKSIMIH